MTQSLGLFSIKAFGLTAAFGCLLLGQNTEVSTGQYGNSRQNANLNEKTLNPSNVNVSSFGKVGTYQVDGAVYAQALYLSQLHLSTGKPFDVLFIATMNNTVYAFDADSPGSAPLWHNHLASAVPDSVAGTCPNMMTGQQLGILSTPVIDSAAGVMYVVYASQTGPATYGHSIVALDIKTGAPIGSPKFVSASVTGTGYDSVNGIVSLNQTTYIQRPALTLANGTVYTAFSSCGPDPDPYHGWVIGYNALTLTQTSVFNSTPNGERGGIWQSGRGLAVDNLGSVYALTGNGSNDYQDFGDSVLKFSLGGLLVNVFTPRNYPDLSLNDIDLSAAGAIYTGSTQRLLAGGKEGVIYLLDPLLIGSGRELLQAFQATSRPCNYGDCDEIHSTAYWDLGDGSLLYVWGINDFLKAFKYSNGQFTVTPDSQFSVSTIGPGGMLALSAHGELAKTGILWALSGEGVLHAFQATNVSNELYNSTLNAARDSAGSPTHYVEPTVADGKVFVPTSDGFVNVYGLLGK